MSNRFVLNVTSPSYFEGIDDSEVVFHAINKSGSMALENAITESFDYSGRSSEYLSHYKIKGKSESFYEKVNTSSSKFVVAHYLWPRIIGDNLMGLNPAIKNNRIWFLLSFSTLILVVFAAGFAGVLGCLVVGFFSTSTSSSL